MHWTIRWPARLCVAALACAGVLAWGTAMAGPALPWFEGGRPLPQARQAVELLTGAAAHGLEPQDYGADDLLGRISRAATGVPPAPAEAEQLEMALTAAMQRFLKDIHEGRVDPRQVHQNVTAPRREAFDAAAALQAARVADRVPQAVQELAPRLPTYERLRQALAGYRALVGHAAWAQPLPPLPPPQAGGGRGAGKLVAGQDWPGTAQLAHRLAALGDLAPDTPVPLRYEGPLLDAVRSFQQRHGLLADGVVGQATLRQLQVDPAVRVRQIELTLERLRWTPLLQGPRMIVVNIPEFVLRAYDVVDGRIDVGLQMKVIVGKALDTRTPLFDADLRFIEFSPYWNVPRSIARAEVVPRLRRDPGWFEREGFEFVTPDGRVDRTLSAANIDALRAGALRIRQRPGPTNALGDIKFVFPNTSSIYLHHTPATSLFERERRDFSHGCIRVEQPVALAGFVLQGMPEWTEERIRQAMGRGRSATLRLAEPLRVLITYGTTLVKDGRIHFFEDIYGHDRLLDEALRSRARTLPALLPNSR